MSTQTYRQRFLLNLLARKRSSGEGFTLIELLVVIVILGVLGAVGYQAYINQIGRANEGTAAVAAVAAAKNCAALRITSDETIWTDGIVNTNQVQITPTECNSVGLQTFAATAGEGANSRSAQALLNSDGSVTD